MAKSVPSTVAMTVAAMPTTMDVPKASQTPCAWQTLVQLSSVNPTHTMFDFTESLNEKMKVYTIGISRKASASALNSGRTSLPGENFTADPLFQRGERRARQLTG